MSDWSSDVCSSDLATAPASSATADDQIATVLVTARRREESLEKVPTSITALGAQQLAQQGSVSQSDLKAAVPGLTVRQTPGSNPMTLSARGQTHAALNGTRYAEIERAPRGEEGGHTRK